MRVVLIQQSLKSFSVHEEKTSFKFDYWNNWNQISKPSYKRSIDLNLIFAIRKENLKHHVTRAQGRQRKLGDMRE